MMFVSIAVNDRDSELIPFVVSLCTWSKAYHCELIFSDGQSLVMDPKGCRFEQRAIDPYKWVILPLPEITEDQETTLRNKAQQIMQTCKGYDWLGAILGVFLKTDVESPRRWYCSELIAYLLKDHITEFQQGQFSPGDIWRIVANHLLDWVAANPDTIYTLNKFVRRNTDTTANTTND